MKMEIDILLKGRYGFDERGSSVLKSIMDDETPNVDLLVRESIQNSSDAILENNTGYIKFDFGCFNNSQLASSLEKINDSLLSRFPNREYDFLAISDYDTCGLIGKATEPRNSTEPGNLYGLVYSFKKSSKSDVNQGGSHGIGKSVYFRFGIGLCFYYSRTHENGKYQEKLVGTVIEDETKKNKLLSSDDSIGIAFFGKNTSEGSFPITDSRSIGEFLEIFGIEQYKGSKTGTIVIIPYFDKNALISSAINDRFENSPWANDPGESLKIAIQRWYFSRLNNEEYDGSHLVVAVNNEKVELNAFYQKLQNLFNYKEENAQAIKVMVPSFPGLELGTFVFKKFTLEELGINVPPVRLPSPYTMLDMEHDFSSVKNEPIIFYQRKPGMTITYDDSKNFFDREFDANEILVGIFVANGKACYEGKILEEYLRECEKANHKSWKDIINTKEENIFAKRKVIRKIQTKIKQILHERFDEQEEEQIETTNLQAAKYLTDLLLPPEDFGNESTIRRRRKTQPKRNQPIVISKKNSINIELIECESDLIEYSFEISLKAKNKLTCNFIVTTSGKHYEFDKWMKFNFPVPFDLTKYALNYYQIGNKKYNGLVQEKQNPREKEKLKLTDRITGKELFHIAFIKEDEVKSNRTIGFVIENNDEKEELDISISLFLSPIDSTIPFSFDSKFEVMKGGM